MGCLRGADYLDPKLWANENLHRANVSWEHLQRVRQVVRAHVPLRVLTCYTRRMQHLMLTFFLFVMAPFSAMAADWEEIYTADGVIVSKKDVEGSRFVAFKGDTVMDADISTVLYVLLDNDHRVEWVDRLYENRVLETIDQHEYVLYQAFDLPAMFASRDYVYHGKATRDPDTGVVTLKMASTEHASAPETVGIRAELTDSRYRLTPTDDGKTRVEVEISTDPRGWMPVWLVNMIQRDWPQKTLNGVRGQLDKPFTGNYPLPGVVMPVVANTDTPAEEEGDTATETDVPVEEPVEEEAAAGEAAPPEEPTPVPVAE
jgi:hypothetical protein